MILLEHFSEPHDFHQQDTLLDSLDELLKLWPLCLIDIGFDIDNVDMMS